MARGWESKEVESQMEAAQERLREAQRPKLPAEEMQRQSEIESLQLSRKRVLDDMEAARNPKYRAMLQKSLSFLDEKIAALTSP